jgi:hypothetical protein
MAIELQLGETSDVGRRTIYRFDDDSRFAFARRQHLIRFSDGRPWAYVSGGYLISARSGECLALRIGSVYYDPESREPIYYEAPTDGGDGPALAD